MAIFSLALFLVLLSILTHSLASKSEQVFTLRHVHSTHSESGHIRWADVSESHPVTSSGSLPQSIHVLQSRSVKTYKPVLQTAFHAIRINTRKRRQNRSTLGLESDWEQSLGWKEDEVEGPAVDKRETLLALAKMTNNAYLRKNQSGWYDLGGNWSADHSIGWDPEVDGFRGHVFLSSDNATAILSIKGTSSGIFGGKKSVQRDKLNNNLLFSCCCARVDWTWKTVCGCYHGGNKCDKKCLEDSLADESLLYHVGINLYNNLTSMYPDAKIWITGHSLGGSLASLIGLTSGVPVVAFGAVPERLAAQRLHLPMPPSTQHITHIYNTADPIAMGVCNGLSSICYAGGYALETKCRLGQTIVYDTVNALHWSVNIQAHFILTITEQLLSEDWSEKVRKEKLRLGLPPDDDDKRVEVPKPTKDEDCTECYTWDFGDYKN